MTNYQTALKLAHDQDYGMLYEFLAGKIGQDQLMHIYAIAQDELTDTNCAQWQVVHTIQTHIL